MARIDSTLLNPVQYNKAEIPFEPVVKAGSNGLPRRKPACLIELGAPSTGNPRTGSLGPIVPEISGFNQIGYEFGDGLSRELLVLGAPSLGSLGRARGELPGRIERNRKLGFHKNLKKIF
ncbi:hypothetical protein ACJJTC_017384 [Scirpophaga incertulas]